MSVELLQFTPKTEKVSIFAVSRFCLSICRKRLSAVLFVVNVMEYVFIIISICRHFYFQTCMIAKDTSVRNMKYVQYIGHIQYLHDSTRRVKGRCLLHNATHHHHRLMCDCCSGTVWHFTIGVVFLLVLLSVLCWYTVSNMRLYFMCIFSSTLR